MRMCRSRCGSSSGGSDPAFLSVFISILFCTLHECNGFFSLPSLASDLCTQLISHFLLRFVRFPCLTMCVVYDVPSSHSPSRCHHDPLSPLHTVVYRPQSFRFPSLSFATTPTSLPQK